jgi:hypothetical protein
VRGAEDMVSESWMNFEHRRNGIDGVFEAFALVDETIRDEDAMGRGGRAVSVEESIGEAWNAVRDDLDMTGQRWWDSCE